MIKVKAIEDDRGVIREFYRESVWIEAGLPVARTVGAAQRDRLAPRHVRGLHGEAMHKLVGIGVGRSVRRLRRPPARLADVPGGRHRSADAPHAGARAEGVCNGFQPTSVGGCTYVYCFDNEWRVGMSGVAVNPLDPALGIDWPIPVDRDDPAAISAKDRSLPTLAELLGN